MILSELLMNCIIIPFFYYRVFARDISSIFGFILFPVVQHFIAISRKHKIDKFVLSRCVRDQKQFVSDKNIKKKMF